MSSPSSVQHTSTERRKTLGKIALATAMMAFILPAAPVNSLAISTGAVAVGVLTGSVAAVGLVRIADSRREAAVRTLVFGVLVVGLGALFVLPTAASYAVLHGALGFLWAYAITEPVYRWLS
ncbi:hypothetical protein [Halovenus salina]|uniref:SPW repeat-containing protein n=1 Tax=Halovenus salina TaxID=1510225 RepID=A0ABD5W577_9EURY|nr:hypothetical protein [Halovenus salina]